MVSTPIKFYGSDEFVPYPTYKCPAKGIERPGHSHPCRRHVDHDGKHQCICGEEWNREGEVDA